MGRSQVRQQQEMRKGRGREGGEGGNEKRKGGGEGGTETFSAPMIHTYVHTSYTGYVRLYTTHSLYMLYETNLPNISNSSATPLCFSVSYMNL